MALSVVNFATGGQSALNTTAATTAINTSTGNLLVVGLRMQSNTMASVQSIKNSAGVAFTAIPATLVTTSGPQVTQFWYMPNITGAAGDVMTATISPGLTFMAICVWEVSGADKSSPLDATATGTGGTATVTSAPFTTTTANEIILAMAAFGALNETFTAQTVPAYVLDSPHFPDVVGARFCGAEHLIVSSIQSGITTSMSATTAAASTIAVATFKQAAGPAGGGSSTWLCTNLNQSLRGLRK